MNFKNKVKKLMMYIVGMPIPTFSMRKVGHLDCIDSHRRVAWVLGYGCNGA